MMSKAESNIRSVLGLSGGSIQPLAIATDVFIQCYFEENIPLDEIMMTKDIYPAAARQLRKTPSTVGRSVERSAKRCWQPEHQARIGQIAGRPLCRPPRAKDILTYFAFYSYLGVPFYTVIEQQSTQRS